MWTCTNSGDGSKPVTLSGGVEGVNLTMKRSRSLMVSIIVQQILNIYFDAHVLLLSQKAGIIRLVAL